MSSKKAASNLFGKVVFAGPDMSAQGGIAAVARSYDEAFGPLRYIPTTSRHGRIASIAAFAIAMLRLPLLRVQGYRTLHAHTSVRGSWTRKTVLMRWARLLGMHTVAHLHSGALREHFSKLGIDNGRRVLEACDAVVALSDGWAAYLKETLGLSNVHTIENIVMPPDAEGEGPKDSNAPLRLLFLGAISEGKGIFDLIDAIADRADYMRGRIELHIGGNGKEFERMTALIRDRGVADIITSHGWVAGAAKNKLLAQADVLVLPSYSEGMPISILEAMAAGLALVTTPVGGIPEIVENGVSGIFVSPGDKNAIAEAIMALAQSRKLAADMGKRGREVAEKFFPEQTLAKIKKMYAAFK